MADTNDALLAAIDKMNASTEALAAKVEALEAEKQAEAERVAAETKAAAEAKAKADAEAAELKELEDERAKAAKERKDTAIGGDEDGTPVRYTRQSSGPVFKNLSDVLAVKADSAPDYKAFIEDFQTYNDDMLSYRMGAHQHGNPADHRRAPGADWFTKPSVRSTIEKALYSTSTGYGDEWVPTEFSTQFLDLVHSEGEILPLISALPMTTNPQTFPVDAGRQGTFYLQGEATEDENAKFLASTGTTASVDLTAKQFALRMLWSQELVEDAVAGSIEKIKQGIANQAALGLDEAIMNGDTTATHFDTGITATADHRRAFDGIRHRALVTATGANVDCAGLTWSSSNKLMKTLSNMGEWMGKNPVAAVSRTFAPLMSLLENRSGYLVAAGQPMTDSAALSVGPKNIFGCKVVPSDAILDTYTTAGIWDNSTKTTTQVVFFNPDIWYLGWRRGWTLEVAKNIATGQWELVLTCRAAFNTPVAAASTTTYISAVAYDLVVANF